MMNVGKKSEKHNCSLGEKGIRKKSKAKTKREFARSMAKGYENIGLKLR